MTARGKSKKLNKAWLHDHLTDPYVKLAQREGYRARAAYKLKEIDEQLHLLEPGQFVVDLGAVPGAWSQYVGASSVAARAPTRRRRPARCTAPSSPSTCSSSSRSTASTSSPATSARPRSWPSSRPGSPAGRSMSSSRTWRRTCRASPRPTRRGWPTWSSSRSISPRRHLRPEGCLVCKVFHGSGYSQLVERFKASFRTVKAVKPKASRAKSAETFLVGIGLKPRVSGADNPE